MKNERDQWSLYTLARDEWRMRGASLINEEGEEEIHEWRGGDRK